jgi:DNA-binding response OmpR family regulator
MAARSPSRNAQPRRTLLYVDDDAGAIRAARAVTAQRELALVVASDLEHALNLARRKPPEVMLVNLDLVALGAATLVHILRANPATHAAPVLALGADAAPEASIKALEAGIFHYLVRPLDAGHLAEALDYALEFSALERAEL